MHKNEGTNEHIGNICLIFNNSNSCVENERKGERKGVVVGELVVLSTWRLSENIGNIFI